MNNTPTNELKELVDKCNFDPEVKDYVVAEIDKMDTGNTLSDQELEKFVILIDNEIKKKEILADFSDKLYANLTSFVYNIKSTRQ